MTKDIKDILVISDLDNTLLTKEGIPQFNIDMIEKFQRHGGRFTLATGRSVAAISPVIRKISLNAPAITYNGGVIWDFNKNRFLHRELLSDSAKMAVLDILEKFPELGCEIMGENFRIYLIKENQYTHDHVSEEKLSYTVKELKDINVKWIKVLFAASQEVQNKVEEYAKTLNFPDLKFVRSHQLYFEILPLGVSKGTALNTLCEKLNMSVNNTVVIGDYYNDVEILKMAGLSVAVDNAPSDIKEICKMVVPSCKEGGVGHLIEQIMKSYNL